MTAATILATAASPPSAPNLSLQRLYQPLLHYTQQFSFVASPRGGHQPHINQPTAPFRPPNRCALAYLPRFPVTINITITITALPFTR